MKKYFILLLLFLVTISAYSQNIDSLYSVFSASKGEKQINAANEILKYSYEHEYMATSYSLKTSDDQTFINATVYAAMGSYYVLEKTDYKKGNDFLKLALEYFEKNGNAEKVNLLNGNIGNNYAKLGDYENAVAYLMKCYEWEKNAGNNEGLSATLNSLGVIYSQWENPEMAINFFEYAEKVERPLNRPYNYSNKLASLAREHLKNNDANKALLQIRKALEYSRKIENEDLREERIAIHTVLLGDIYYELDSLERAENCFRESLFFFETHGRTYYVANTLLELGRLQIKAKQYEESIKTLKRCAGIAEENSFLPVQRNAYYLLIKANNELAPDTLIYSYFKKYLDANDSIFKETSQKQINEFHVKYETAEKQLEIERQQMEIRRQRTRQYAYIGGLLAAGLLVGLLIYTVILRTRRARLLAETNATKDKFFSIISHDLKNPAISQRDALQLLLDNSEKWDTVSLTNYYRKLLKSANEQVNLLFALLGWAQIQTGRMPYNPVQVDLAGALHSCIDLTKNMADAKEIIFDVQMPEIAIITGDYNMLTTVVRNLLTNAIKFTSKGGTVSLNVSPCCQDAASKVSTRFTVLVADTGIGMSQEQIQNIFKIDRQHSSKGTAGEKGSGLGLIVCRELLQKHDSQLNIESEEGKGSRFWFSI